MDALMTCATQSCAVENFYGPLSSSLSRGESSEKRKKL